MAKNLISNAAFQKKSTPKTDFTLISQTNSFNSIFGTKPLDEKTSNAIDRLVYDLVTPENASEEKIRSDLTQLKNITLEVKAIEKQGILLIGERLFKAREILGRFKKDTDSFKAWLNIVFKNRSSAYNILAYYELYNTLPQNLQSKLKEMPYRAAYILASRKGEIEEKYEIVEKYSEMKADEIIAIVQDKFPSIKKDAKQSIPTNLIDVVRSSLKRLILRKSSLTERHFAAISECQTLLQALISSLANSEPSIKKSLKNQSS